MYSGIKLDFPQINPINSTPNSYKNLNNIDLFKERSSEQLKYRENSQPKYRENFQKAIFKNSRSANDSPVTSQSPLFRDKNDVPLPFLPALNKNEVKWLIK